MTWRVSGPHRVLRQIVPDSCQVDELGNTVVYVETYADAGTLAMAVIMQISRLDDTGSVSIRQVGDGEGGA